MMKGRKKNEESSVETPVTGDAAAQSPAEPAAPAAEGTAPATGPAPALLADAAVGRLESTLLETENRLVRLQADFDNYRKRALRERDELWQRAHAELILELLPVLDHMDLALESAKAHDAPAAFTEGFRLVGDQMRAALQKFGLAPFDAVGEVFDTSRHEAVVHAPSAEVEENRVVAQTRRGYLLGSRLLRPAQVVVSSGKPAAAEPPKGE